MGGSANCACGVADDACHARGLVLVIQCRPKLVQDDWEDLLIIASYTSKMQAERKSFPLLKCLGSVIDM